MTKWRPFTIVHIPGDPTPGTPAAPANVTLSPTTENEAVTCVMNHAKAHFDRLGAPDPAQLAAMKANIRAQLAAAGVELSLIHI